MLQQNVNLYVKISRKLIDHREIYELRKCKQINRIVLWQFSHLLLLRVVLNHFQMLIVTSSIIILWLIECNLQHIIISTFFSHPSVSPARNNVKIYTCTNHTVSKRRSVRLPDWHDSYFSFRKFSYGHINPNYQITETRTIL